MNGAPYPSCFVPSVRLAFSVAIRKLCAKSDIAG